jgi:Transposase zinc-ribbon domain
VGVEPVGGRPRAGVEYPRDGREFERWFVDEASCAAYLERLRWPAGFSCARCAGRRCWLIATRPERRPCASCRFEVSLRSGTLLADSRVPLGVWLRAVWLVSSQKRGVSALDL